MTSRPVGAQRTIAERQRALMRWYAKHGRHALPWRHGITPYRVLVSEVMLQQTQVDRVAPYFERWMERWPTMEHLARARRSSVVRAWAGLGYNRRAVNLHRAAQEIVGDAELRMLCSDQWREISPLRSRTSSGRNDVTRELGRMLQHLPGVGSYTANALLAFAWNLPAPCVDTNVRRVLAYAIVRRPAIMQMPLQEVERLAERVIPSRKGRMWNYALMDYGALVFTARDVPKTNRPKPTQKTFQNSTRFWRGRIVSVLAQKNERRTVPQLRVALKHFGNPPRALTPLLRALERDGVVVERDGYYTLA
ncbi:MAG: hypothetical protein Q7S96_04155 [bacterium]|nr:hypothetical protein [bacterium]